MPLLWKDVDGDEDDHEEDEVHEVQEVHTCKWRCSG